MRNAVEIYCALLLLAMELGGGNASPLRDKFIVHSSELSPREGQTLTLSCFIGGPPQASIPSPSSYEWVKDGKVIPGQRGQTLTIEKLSVQAEGDYQCGPPGSDVPREVYRLDVIHGNASPKREKFIVLPSEWSPREGHTLTLSCVIGGPPQASIPSPSSYEWVKDGKVIPSEAGQTLIIENLSVQDEGDYQCGSPGSDVSREVYRLDVIRGNASPKREKFIVLPSEWSPREGHTLTLSCVIGGPPQASIPSPSSYEWVKDGKVIPGQIGQTLTIEKLSGQAEGDYQCGPPGSEVSREVYRLDVIRSEKSPLNGIMFYVDKFGSTLQGRTATLRCYLFGLLNVRPSSYQWLKDAKVIAGATQKDLPLKSLSSSDTGDYLCGDPSTKYPRRNYHLQVITILPTPTIFKDRLPVCGQSFSLYCIVMAGYSTTGDTAYTWYKDSTEIKGQTGPLLWFDNVTKADTGKYTCTARDGPMDTTSHHSQGFDLDPLMNHELRIKEASPNSLLKGVVDENLTLTCEVIRSNPMVPYKDYSWSFLPSLQVNPRTLAETSRTLTLGPLTKEDAGQYFCQTRNGQNFETVTLIGRASVTVDILYLDNISVTATTRVNESDHVTITCKVDSHPIAHLVWVVHGEEVRHVIDNLDHYVIPKAACTDSTNYTCRATNADLPGRNISATALLLDNCEQRNGLKRGRQQQQQQDLDESHNEVERLGSNEADVTAQFHFSLPEHTSVVVVCPDNQDIITVHQNCSFVISPKFRSRCLLPQCNTDSHHLTFTLTHVTNRDEGHYSCLEAKQRKPIVGCDQRLVLKGSDVTLQVSQVWWISGLIAGVVLVASAILQIFVQRHKIPKLRIRIQRSFRTGIFSFTFWRQLMTRSQGDKYSHNFKTLYERGKVYVFPSLVPPEQQASAVNEEKAKESSPLLQQTEEETEFTVKDLIRYTLQAMTGHNDLPSFLLHNTCLSRKENIVVILSRKLGIVLMTIKSFNDLKHESSIQNAARHLAEARKAITETLRGCVKPSMIAAAICMPRMPQTDVNLLKKRLKNVEVLQGLEQEDFQQWADKLSSRPDSDVWDLSARGVDTPDDAYKMAASRFLTLADCCDAERPPCRPTAVNAWLLTHSQMEVRDSTAKLLHVWGPPGSGKSTLLIHRAKRWLAEGKAVVIAVGKVVHDVLFAHVVTEMLREQKEEIRKKIRVCRFSSQLQLTLTELASLNPNVEICLFIDALQDDKLFRDTIKAVRSKQVSTVWSVCRDSLQTLDYELSKDAHSLGWESFKLPESISCTSDTVDLLNRLEIGSPSHYHTTALSIPRTRDIPRWRVVDHYFHPNHLTSALGCDGCSTELSDALISPDRHPSWSDWIALYAGNPNVFNDIKPICEALRKYNIPATLDKHYEKIACHGSHLDSSQTDVFQWHERVVAGVAETGEPIVHLVRVRDSIGIWKEGVLMVHWDKRDNNPNCQSPEDRQTRLEEHRYLWFLAVSRSKGQVILLLLTPSPARSLLGLAEAVMPTAKA